MNGQQPPPQGGQYPPPADDGAAPSFDRGNKEFTFAPEEDVEKDPGLAPDGRYRLRVTKAEAGQTKKGDPMIVIEMEIIDPPQYSHAAQSYWPIKDYISFGKPSERMTYQKLKALGVATRPGAAVTFKPSDLVDKIITADIKVDTSHFEKKDFTKNTLDFNNGKPTIWPDCGAGKVGGPAAAPPRTVPAGAEVVTIRPSDVGTIDDVLPGQHVLPAQPTGPAAAATPAATPQNPNAPQTGGNFPF